MISAHSLSFSYDNHTNTLRDLSLEVPQGSLFGLLGPNGAGKSTLLNLFNGLLPVQKGKLVIGNADTKISLVPQDFAFYPSLSVQENLNFFAKVQGLVGKQCQQAIEHSLFVTRLEEHTKQRAASFSGGLKRRLNLAIGLLNNPDLLFLDEPTVGIDAQSRHFLLNSIQQLNRNGTTVVYTSHYMEEIETLCDHIAIMDHGEIKRCGSLESLLHECSSDTAYIGLDNSIDQNLRSTLQQRFENNIDINDKTISCFTTSSAMLADILNMIEQSANTVTSIEYGKAKKLEALFLELTDKALRP